MIPEAGQRFGPYEILGKLGRGGMGHVFRAWDQRLQREVAVKLLHPDDTMPRMRERFLQEARAASALNHPNICTIFDIGERDGEPYLVMEVLEGETLKDRLAQGVLTSEEIVRYAGEVADAMAMAHARGIVHRDLKPANIFLVLKPDGRSQAKVLDFGLAKMDFDGADAMSTPDYEMTLAGATVGTLAYMSPEQARGESLDGRADLFSLGVVIYEMATLQLPFKGRNDDQRLLELFHHVPEAVRQWNESIPVELEQVISKLLAKDPRERFQSARDLRDSLTRISEKIADKLGRGSWLSKPVVAAVPLVPAPDPVARHRYTRRSRTEADHDSSASRPAAGWPASASSANRSAAQSSRGSSTFGSSTFGSRTDRGRGANPQPARSTTGRVSSAGLSLKTVSPASDRGISDSAVNFVRAGWARPDSEPAATLIRSSRGATPSDLDMQVSALQQGVANSTEMWVEPDEIAAAPRRAENSLRAALAALWSSWFSRQ